MSYPTPLEAALRFRSAGISIIPIQRGGKKDPACKWGVHKGPDGTIANEIVVRGWFANDLWGVAAVGGIISGNLFLIDIEYEDIWLAYQAIVNQHNPELLQRLPKVRTPGRALPGGIHLYGRAARPIPSRKLAQTTPEDATTRCGEAGSLALIEIKGEGGYALVPGCPAECHASGRLYEWLTDSPPLEDTPVLTEAEIEILVTAAYALNRHVPEPSLSSSNGSKYDPNKLRPGDQYNKITDWRAVLEPHGWVLVNSNGDVETWRRPGKNSGISATTGYCKTEESGSLLYVFSTNANPFTAENTYSKFAAFTLLNHNGNFKLAAGAIADQLDGTVYVLPPGVVLDENANPDAKLIWALEQNDMKFSNTWRHKRADLTTGIHGLDLSLAIIAVKAEWTDQHIVNLIVAHRRIWDEARLPELLKTNHFAKILALGKKLASAGTAKIREAVTAMSVEEAIRDASGGTGDNRFNALRQVLGNLPVVRVVRRQQKESVYYLVLESGQEIDLGGDVENMKLVRVAIVNATGGVYVMPPLKGYQWFPYAQLIWRLAELLSMGDAELPERISSSIKAYLEEANTPDIEEEAAWRFAFGQGQPFRKDGSVHINKPNFVNFLKQHRGHNFDEGEVFRGLHALGFTADRVNYDGKTRWYWISPPQWGQEPVVSDNVQ